MIRPLVLPDQRGQYSCARRGHGRANGDLWKTWRDERQAQSDTVRARHRSRCVFAT